ncbi:hypothetical protein [Polaromonas sp. CG_9.11]|uniref:hypothetical protein n=1 Tax=Polaromonas sp. CG_9.11 TaxID=2787730 RepID=UPI0018C91D6F|nr:hypothetical protein [Polaromonas sp. CG_9.11]
MMDTERQDPRGWQIARQESIVENLIGNPALLALAHSMPINFARWSELIARADAELAQRAMDELP